MSPLEDQGVCVRVSVCVCVRVCVSVPVDPFVVAVGVEELDLFVGLWAGQVAGDGRMHQQEQVQRCGPCNHRTTP